METERSQLEEHIATMVLVHGRIAIAKLTNAPEKLDCNQRFDAQDMLSTERENSKCEPDLEPAEQPLPSLKDQVMALALSKLIRGARPFNGYSALRSLSSAQSFIKVEPSIKERPSMLTECFT